MLFLSFSTLTVLTFLTESEHSGLSLIAVLDSGINWEGLALSSLHQLPLNQVLIIVVTFPCNSCMCARHNFKYCWTFSCKYHSFYSWKQQYCLEVLSSNDYARCFDFNGEETQGGKSSLKTSRRMQISTVPWATLTLPPAPPVIRWVTDPLVSRRCCFSNLFILLITKMQWN